MGNLADFNLQLNDSSRRFTYFVPRETAWENARIDFPSIHKKLFMGDFSYQVRSQALPFVHAGLAADRILRFRSNIAVPPDTGAPLGRCG